MSKQEWPPLESMLKTGAISAASIWARFTLDLPADRAAHLQAQLATGWRPVASFVNAPEGWRCIFALMNQRGELQNIEIRQSKVQVNKLN